MASGKGTAPPDEAKPSKKDKKDKKRSESDGVGKAKKDRKEKKKSKEKLVQALDEHLQASVATAAAAADTPADMTDEEMLPAVTAVRGALVEFAKPMASDKHQKKMFKCIKKASKTHAILRGVKEVNKALRKSPAHTPSATQFPGIVIIAGDISPAEVIMHLPLACEDVNAPYMFVPSRAELGAAAKTKRPTSVVMLLPQGKKGKEVSAEDEADYAEAYGELAKLLEKEYAKQMRGLI